MTKFKICKDCNRVLPETRDYFGQYKNKLANGGVSINFRNSCRECMAARTSKYRADNPEKVRESIRERLDKVARSGGSYSPEDIARIRIALSDRCRFCDAPLNNAGHIEHLCPVSRGGSSNPTNLTLACSKCNLAKTNKTLTEFMAWRKERSLNVREIFVANENPDMPSGSAGRVKA